MHADDDNDDGDDDLSSAPRLKRPDLPPCGYRVLKNFASSASAFGASGCQGSRQQQLFVNQFARWLSHLGESHPHSESVALLQKDFWFAKFLDRS